MPGITATIITLNEEDRIAETISNLACCDEILVVDASSTDRTCEIATALGARVITRAWQGYSRQKNFAAEQAQHDWILSIDADERLSMELADEIVYWKKSVAEGSGFEKACDPHPARQPREARARQGEASRNDCRAVLSQGETAVSMPRRVFYLGR